MKAVIIGASAEALHTIEKAKENGLYVTALDGNPEAAGLRAADKGLIVDISDEATTIETVRKEQPDFVLTVPIGRYLTTIGAVNDALGLPGISKEMAVLCTDKYQFHERLRQQGLRSCHCYAAGDDGQASEVLLKKTASGELSLGFPAILKPRYGSGSRGIHMVLNKEELQAALQEIGEEAYVLEECIIGEEYGVDGAVVEDSFQLVLLRKKENTPPPVRQAVGYFSVLPEDVFYRQVKEYMEKVVSCLGLKECILHADVIRGAEGPFAIELSARPSGHNLHNLFTPLCTGVDLAEEYIKYRLRKPYHFAPDNTEFMLIHYFDMEGSVKKIPDEGKIAGVMRKKESPLTAWECRIKEGEELAPVSDGHSLMGRGYFVLRGSNQAQLLMYTEEIKRFFME